MKKFIYIAVVFIAVLLFNSCDKRHFEPCEKDDPFEISTSDNDERVKALSDNDGDGDGGVGIVDPDDDDDEMDEDDDKHVED